MVEQRGRAKLTEEEKALREQQRDALFPGRKKNIRKESINNDITNTDNNMLNEEPNPNPDQIINQTPSVEPGVETPEQVQQNTPAPAEPVVTNNNESSGSNAANYQPNKSWKPLSGNKIERDYSTPQIDPSLLTQEIPEINIGIQNAGPTNSSSILNKPIADTTPKKPEAPTPVVSNWNELSDTEKRESAAMSADMILGAYDKLHHFGRMAIKVDDDEIIQAHSEDRIDMHAGTVESDSDPDKEVTIQDFWKDFNKQVDERFVVSDQFKSSVRPPLERLCMKYGLGASDGAFLAFKFGEDALTKVAMVVGFKKTVNGMKDMFEKNHAKFKAEVEKQVQKQLATENKMRAEAAASINKEQSAATIVNEESKQKQEPEIK